MFGLFSTIFQLNKYIYNFRFYSFISDWTADFLTRNDITGGVGAQNINLRKIRTVFKHNLELFCMWTKIMYCNCKILFYKNLSKSAHAIFREKCYLFRIFAISTPWHLNLLQDDVKHVFPEQFCAKKPHIPEHTRTFKKYLRFFTFSILALFKT